MLVGVCAILLAITGRLRTLRPIRGSRALPYSLVVGLLFFSAVAGAAERQKVQGVFTGEPLVTERVISVLRRSLERQGLELSARRALEIDPRDAIRVTRAPSAEAPVAYLWLDLSAPQPTLLLVEAKSRLIYARPLSVHADPDDVETELIRFVVDQSLDAILSGSAPGVTPEEFQRTLPAEPAKPAEPPRVSAAQAERGEGPRRWAFGAGYSFGALGADGLAHGPELGLEFRLPAIRFELRVSQRLPFRVTRADARVRMMASGARLVAAAPLALRPGLTAALGVGAGLEVARVTPSAGGAVPAFWVSDPLLVAEFTLEQAWDGWLLAGYGSGEWAFVAARYTITRDDDSATVWQPTRVRWGAGLRLGHVF